MYKKLKPANPTAKPVHKIIYATSSVTKLAERGIIGRLKETHFYEARAHAIMLTVDMHPELKLIEVGAYFDNRNPNHINQYYKRAKHLYDTCDIFRYVHDQIEKIINV